MILDELLNLLFRFALRRLGAELDGGGRLDAPSPGRPGKFRSNGPARVK